MLSYQTMVCSLTWLFFCPAVNMRERFPSGRPGGFRNDGPRGRGNYGGNRGYNRGEMNRPDFGNRNSSRGWYPHRGDGHNRADRLHGSFDSGEPPKNMAPRVPATAWAQGTAGLIPLVEIYFGWTVVWQFFSGIIFLSVGFTQTAVGGGW